MAGYLEDLITELSKLPGIGGKSAEKLAYYFLRRSADENRSLGGLLKGLKDNVRFCSQCGNFTDKDLCRICERSDRDREQICVVEEPREIRILEKIGLYRGYYHVLGGLIEPLQGKGPDDLNIEPLLHRIKEGTVKEVIIAFSQTTEGDMTGMYIHKIMKPLNIRVTRLRSGIPVGSDLEYVDALTLGRSFEDRQPFPE